MRWVLPLSLALLSTPAALQADWKQIGSTVDDSVYFMDPERIKVVGTKKHVWVKVDHSRDRSVTYRESMRLLSFDCDKQQSKLLYYNSTDSYGKSVKSQNFPDYGSSIGYSPIVPDSIGETISRLACYDPASQVQN